MTVYTYFEQDPELSESYKDILYIWAEAWAEAGFNPVVLDRTHAEQHPLYNALVERVESYPCVNPKGYQLACFLRWLALAQVGGGLAVDADVLPAKNIHDPAVLRDHCYGSNHILFLEGTYCPCAVYADKDGAEFIAKHLTQDTGIPALPTGSGPNISDQEALRWMATNLPIRCVPLVGNYPDEFKPFIHYSTCALAIAGKISNTSEKAQAIRTILHNA